MLVNITPITIDKCKIDQIARLKGGIIGRLFVRSPYIGSYLEYVPAYKLTFHFEGRKFSVLSKNSISKIGEIGVVAESQSMRIGVIEQSFPIIEIEVPENTILPSVTFNEDNVVLRSIKLVRKAVTLRYRIMPKVIHVATEIFYRPRWISQYGTNDKITHQLITSADSFKFIR